MDNIRSQYPQVTYDVLIKPAGATTTWQEFPGLDIVDRSDVEAIYAHLQQRRTETPDLMASEFRLIKVERTLGPYVPAHYDLTPPDLDALHVPRADGLGLCEYDDEDWPCTYARQHQTATR